MSLTDIWQNSRNQLKDKHIQQIMAFAGDGRLTDGSKASEEFRAFLSIAPSDLLQNYSDQCLQDSFGDSGLALQDIINQVGRRLGFTVTDGRYRGASGHIGLDGLWRLPSGHAIVVEVKTTDAYRIDLDKLAEYRRSLIKEGSISEQNSSILIIVGRKDTGDLEAQIRGSRHAWNMRLISVDALMRLMVLKQEVEDPQIVQRIHNILIPREFTKLDEIVEIVFFTAEDIREESPPPEASGDGARKPKFIPVSFHQVCVDRIEKYLKLPLIKRTRASFSSSDGSLVLSCLVSKEHISSGRQWYWFAFYPHQKDFLQNAEKSFVAFGCGSEETVLLIPAKEFLKWLDDLNVTKKGDRSYWHVHITRDNAKILMHRKGGADRVDLTKFLLPNK